MLLNECVISLKRIIFWKGGSIWQVFSTPIKPDFITKPMKLQSLTVWPQR